MNMLWPNASALRDLAVIRRRLLVRAIEALANGPHPYPDELQVTEYLWSMRPRIQSLAARMVRHELTFQAKPATATGQWRVAVFAWNSEEQEPPRAGTPLPSEGIPEEPKNKAGEMALLKVMTPAPLPIPS